MFAYRPFASRDVVYCITKAQTANCTLSMATKRQKRWWNFAIPLGYKYVQVYKSNRVSTCAENFRHQRAVDEKREKQHRIQQCALVQICECICGSWNLFVKKCFGFVCLRWIECVRRLLHICPFAHFRWQKKTNFNLFYFALITNSHDIELHSVRRSCLQTRIITHAGRRKLHRNKKKKNWVKKPIWPIRNANNVMRNTV